MDKTTQFCNLVGQADGMSTKRTHCIVLGDKGGKDTIEPHSLRLQRMRLGFLIAQCVVEAKVGGMIA